MGDAAVEQISAADDKLKARGIEIVDGARNGRDMIEAGWADSNDLYDSKFSSAERKMSEMLGIPRLFIPKTYAQVQRILEDVMEAFFFDMQEIASVVSWKSIPAASLQIVKNLINYRLNGHPINIYQETLELVEDTLKNNVGVWKIYPRLRIVKGKSVKVDETGSEAPDPKSEDREDVIKRFSPIVETCNYEDVFFHRQATWKDYYKYPIAHRVIRSRDWCLARGYKNVDAVQTSEVGTDQVKNQRMATQGSPFNPQAEQNKAIQGIWVWEFWDFKEGKDELESGSFVMGGSADAPGIVFRGWKKNELPYQFDWTEAPRSPFVVASAFPEPHVMYGKNFPKITEGLQKETNAQRNQEREAVARALRAPILADRNAGLDLMGLMIRKIGGVVQGDAISTDHVRELTSQNPIPFTDRAQQRTDNDYAEISSITPSQLGVLRDPSQSATQFAGLNRNANKMIKKIIRNIAFTGFLPMLQMVLRLEQEYESDEFIEMVTGRTLGWQYKKTADGKYVGPPPSLVIQGDFDFTMALGTEKQAQITQWRVMTELGNNANAVLGTLVQGGVAQAKDVKFFNPMFAFEQIAKLLGEKNIEEIQFGASPPPPPPGNAPNPKGTPSAPAVSGPMAPAQEALNAPG